MKKLIMVLVVMLAARAGWAQSQQFAGRYGAQGTLTNQTWLMTGLGSPARLANFSVIYSGVATNGYVALWARLSGTEYLQMSNNITGARSWVYTGTDMWFKPAKDPMKPNEADALIFRSNITNVTATAAADLVR